MNALLKILLFGIVLDVVFLYSVSEEDIVKRTEEYQEYYSCLAERNSDYFSENYRKAVIVEHYNSITVKCNACRRPEVNNPGDFIIWKRQFKSQANFELIDDELESERYHLNDYRDELTIFNARPVDEGHYWCELYNTLTVINDYYVTVVSGELKIPVFENATNTSISSFHFNFLKYDTVKSTELFVYVNWDSWGECSVCGQKNGVRRRVGYCYVKLKNEESAVVKRDFKIFSYFKNFGLPCHSSLISLKMKNKLKLNELKSFVMYGDCFTPCVVLTTKSPIELGSVITLADKQKVLEVKDLHRINLKEFLPKKMPFVTSNQVIKTEIGRSLRLRCETSVKTSRSKFDVFDLTNDLLNFPVYWRFSGRVLNAKTIANETKNRVLITENDNVLHIRSIKREDTGVYSCYKKDHIIAIIKVKLSSFTLSHFQNMYEKEVKKYMQNVSVAFGSLILIGTFLISFSYAAVSRATRNKIG